MSYYCDRCQVRQVKAEHDLCIQCQTAQASAHTRMPAPSQVSSSDNSQPKKTTGRKILTSSAVANQPAASKVTSSQTQNTSVSSSTCQTEQAGKTTTQAARGAFIAEGIVKNIDKTPNSMSGLQRWFESLRHGVPYARDSGMTEFQIYGNWIGGPSANSYNADKVLLYGSVHSGGPVENNMVRVYGKRMADRSIVASAIENTVDGTWTVLKPQPIPSFAVRLVSLGILLSAMALVMKIIQWLKRLVSSAPENVQQAATDATHLANNVGAAVSNLLVNALLLLAGAWILINGWRGFTGIFRGRDTKYKGIVGIAVYFFMMVLGVYLTFWQICAIFS